LLRSKQEELRRLLAIKGERQVRLASRPHAPEEEAALATEIDELSRQYDEVEGEIQKADPQRSGVVGAGPPTLRSLQELLDDETLLLEYALGDERSYAWLVSRGSFRSYELPARRELESLARTLHE